MRGRGGLKFLLLDKNYVCDYIIVHLVTYLLRFKETVRPDKNDLKVMSVNRPT
jgi:hypothetical protein